VEVVVHAYLNTGQLHPFGKSPYCSLHGRWIESRTALDVLKKGNAPLSRKEP
jgi:hypothetical protein